VRLFAASFFGPEFVNALKDIADHSSRSAGGDSVRWVEPSNFHITYAFLGELDEKNAAAAARGIEAGLDGVKSFRVVTGELGVFPFSLRPSVLWVGIGEGGEELKSAAAGIAAGLADNSLAAGSRFEPHVTIGRVKRPLPKDFVRLAAGYAAGKKAASIISSVELVESRLTPTGPVYRRVFSRTLL